MTTNVHGENEPLLRASSPSVCSVATVKPQSSWRRYLKLQRISGHGIERETQIVVCVLCLQFLVSFAKHIIEVPTIRLFEIAICDRYYNRLNTITQVMVYTAQIDEEKCKIPVIQNDLAFLVGWRFAFDALPGVLTALIYGRLADRFGRRPILSLSCLGLLCSLIWVVFVCYANKLLPVKLVWASSVFVLIVSKYLALRRNPSKPALIGWWTTSCQIARLRHLGRHISPTPADSIYVYIGVCSTSHHTDRASLR